MNKKALFFHWIIFGIIAAIGITTLSLIRPDLPAFGEWQYNLIDLETGNEKNILLTKQAIKTAFHQTIPQLANQGGFFQENECGKLNDIYLWNRPTTNQPTWCLPNPEKELIALLTKKLQPLAPTNHDLTELETSFTSQEIFFYETDLIIKGEKKSTETISGPYTKLIYLPSFRLRNYQSFLQDYQPLKAAAVQLVDACKNQADLQACIQDKQPNWYFTDCQNSFYQEIDQKVSFCVKGIETDQNYYFALDFSPSIVS